MEYRKSKKKLKLSKLIAIVGTSKHASDSLGRVRLAVLKWVEMKVMAYWQGYEVDAWIQYFHSRTTTQSSYSLFMPFSTRESYLPGNDSAWIGNVYLSVKSKCLLSRIKLV
jgi:hypothetical protein